MSERTEVAERIMQFARDNDIDFFGGEVSQSSDKRYYGFLIGKPRTLDGFVRVYSPKYILIQLQGPLAHGGYDAVYQSEADAIEFLRLLCVEYDAEAAWAVPTKAK
jgi:hypothetical protein